MMVGVFARLWLLTGEDDYRKSAEELIRAFSGDLEKDAFALATLVNESNLLTRAAQTVIIGADDDSDAQALIKAALTAPQPNLVLQRIDPGAELPDGHPARGKTQLDGKATAYVCVGTVCSLPITSQVDLQDALTRA